MIPPYLPSVGIWETLKAVLFASFCLACLMVATYIITERDRKPLCKAMVEVNGKPRIIIGKNCLFGRGNVEYIGQDNKKYNVKGFEIP